MTVALMMNMKAGVGRTQRLAAYVFEQFNANGIPFEHVTGNSAAEAIENVSKRAHEFSAVVSVGGDGSVHTAAQVAHRHGLPLGIIASGSGDDVARAVGLPHGRNYEATQRAVDHFVAAWKAGDKRPIDGLVVKPAAGGQRLVLAVISFGFDSRVSTRSARMTYLKGTFRYIAGMLVTLAKFSPIKYEAVIDGETKNFSAMLVAMGNGSMFGGGMMVCPSAVPNDGEMDLCVVNEISVPSLLAIFPKVFKGTHVHHPKVDTLRAREIWIKAPGEQIWGDGEFIGEHEFHAVCQPGAVEIYGVRLP